MRRGAAFLLAAALSATLAAQTREVTVLATTDLHGNILPYDYYTAQPAERGLAKIASLVKRVRAETRNTILIDCGDTIQGSPLEYVYQHSVRTGSLPLDLGRPDPAMRGDPMMRVMNRLGFDAMVLGNHEFNFGLASLNAARKDARFPWLSANTVARGAARPFPPYLVKEAGSIKVAIVAVTTPAVPGWEKPENYAGYEFIPGVEAVRQAVQDARSRKRPDVVIVAAHAGLDRDLKTGEAAGATDSRENMVRQIATDVQGIDAIVFGHTHRQLEHAMLGDVLLVQPKNWGASLARIDFTLERREAGGWRVASKRSRLIPVTEATPADPEILALARPYHEAAERYLNTPVAHSAAAMNGRLARFMDTPMVDAIHEVQLHYAKADVSFTAMFNTTARIPKGQVTVREIAGLYVYDNELFAVEGTGRMVKDALENAARFFLPCADEGCSAGPRTDPKTAGFNFDMAQGVSYEIHLREPVGRRVRSVLWRGRELRDDQPLRLAINNYRAAGSAGYGMFRGAKIVWRSAQDVRDLMVAYYTERGELPSAADGNWRLIPESALQVLLRPGGTH